MKRTIAVLAADKPVTVHSAATYARLCANPRRGSRPGRLNLARAPVDVNGVAVEVAETFAPAAAEREIRILSELDATLPVDADRSRLSQVLNNLTPNALKLTLGRSDERDPGHGDDPDAAARAAA